MPVQWSKIEIPFRQGLDEKTKPEALDNASLTTAKNTVQQQPGGWTKRPGSAALPIAWAGRGLSGSLAAGRKLFPTIDSAGLIDGGNVYTFSPTANKYQFLSQVPQSTAYRIPGVGFEREPTYVDVAYANGYIVLVWGASKLEAFGAVWTLFVTVLDAATGTRVIADQEYETGLNPYFRTCSVGNFVIIVWRDDADHSKLGWTYIDTTTGVVAGSPAFLNLGGHNVLAAPTSQFLDVFGGTSMFYVAFADDTNHTRVHSFTTAGAVVASASVNTFPIDTRLVALAGNQSDTILLAVNSLGDAQQIAVYMLDPTTLATSATSAANIVALPTVSEPPLCSMVWTGAGAGTLVATDILGGSTKMFIQKFVKSGSNIVKTSTTKNIYRVVDNGKPFTQNGRQYLPVMHVDAGNTAGIQCSQGMTGLLDITISPITNEQPYLCGVIAPKLCRRQVSDNILNPDQAIFVTPATAINGTKVYVPYIVIRSESTNYSLSLVAGSEQLGNAVSIDIGVYDFAYPNSWQTAILGEATGLSCGMPLYFDGNQCAEMGFWAYPEVSAVLAAGNGLTLSSSYTYCAVYEHVDHLGNIHRSAPSVPSGVITPVTPGTQDVNVTVTYPQVTARANGTITRVVLYRAVNDGTYHRVAFSERAVSSVTNKVVILDGLSDSQLQVAPELYTQPLTNGVALPRFIPPSFTCLIQHQDRMFGVADDRKNIWYSGQYVYGEAIWWTNGFQFPVDAAGPITALGSLDGRLYVFKRQAIFYVDGSGPADNGTGGDFALPVQIPTNTGCIEPRSVVASPVGLFFQSDQGIYVLTRAQEVQYIGRNVEATLGNNPVISSATVDEKRGRVYFTCAATEGANTGVVLVYDFVTGTWTSFTYSEGGTNPAAIQSACMVGGAFAGRPSIYFLRPNGVVLKEASDYQDTSSTFVAQSWATGWIKVDGEQGYSRVREVSLLAENLTPHDVTMEVRYNYDDDPSSTHKDSQTWTAAEIAALVTNREQLSISCSTQKAEVFKVSITEVANSSGTRGTGQGLNIMGLACEVGGKAGAYRLPAANQK